MKVSIIGSRGYPSHYGGFETFVKELSERLVTMDIQVTIYCHRKLFDSKPKRLNKIDLVYVPSIETKILSQLTNSFLSVIHACFSKSDVIVMLNSANGPLGVFTKVFGKKTIINVDGIEWERPKWKGLGSKYFYMASWLATKLYDTIVTDSSEMREVYLRHFNCDSKVIAYGANVRSSKDPELIFKWNLNSNDYYLIVGRLIPDNNADIIIEGYLRSFTKKKLVIIGDVLYKDTYAKGLKEIGVNDDRIIFTGYISDQDELAELYHHSYCYIHGHEYGGTNPAMLKALAYGCAILALDTRFNREMLQNGKYGNFFTKDSMAISNEIDLMDNDSNQVQRLKNSSRNGLGERYQWDFIANQYFNLFKKSVKS